MFHDNTGNMSSDHFDTKMSFSRKTNQDTMKSCDEYCWCLAAVVEQECIALSSSERRSELIDFLTSCNVKAPFKASCIWNLILIYPNI